MANYEIMMIVSGSLKDTDANKVANEIASSIKTCKPKVTEYGSKQLAYKIKKDDTGYYYQYNFECESPAMINEFRRLSSINKFVLRTLIINLEKDYLYRASVNPKKVERSKKTYEIHQKIKAKIEEQKALKNLERMNKLNQTEKPSSEAKTVAHSETTETKTKKSKTSDIPSDKKHVVISAESFETEYDYAKRRSEWHKLAGHNEKQLVCDFCKDDDNWETILLSDNRHVCYYCWIKKPESATKTKKTTTKKTTTKKATSSK